MALSHLKLTEFSPFYMVLFAQLVTGPPGAGKSTYCNAMDQICSALDRPHILVNLDPANDGETLGYTPDVDIRELVTVEQMMDSRGLGPNGALLACMEFLWENVDWLEQRLTERTADGCYCIIDMPGQVELYTCHDRGIVRIMERLCSHKHQFEMRATSVHLMDATLIADPFKYISALLTSLSGQVMLELPHVNVLTKCDLLAEVRHDMAFRIEFYAEVDNLHHLFELESLMGPGVLREHPIQRKYGKFLQDVCELVTDYNIIGFQLLDINSKESMLSLLKVIDTANGFAFGQALLSDPNWVGTARGFSPETLYADVQEKYLDSD